MKLARRNTAHLPDVVTLKCGLAGKSGLGRIKPALHAHNHSGLTIAETSAGDVPVYDYPRLLEAAGVPFFDLLKIDIEGAEYPFLKSVDDAALGRCKWIVARFTVRTNGS